jgi:hypothetical protein
MGATTRDARGWYGGADTVMSMHLLMMTGVDRRHSAATITGGSGCAGCTWRDTLCVWILMGCILVSS